MMSRATGGRPTPTPACVLAAARGLPGWSLASHQAERFPDGRMTVTLNLSFRGAYAVPHDPFRHLNGFYAVRVHSFVFGQRATLWLTIRPNE
jgi:hypothetical protein